MTDRIPLDHLTSDALDALYERLEAAEDTETQRQLATAREALASATTRAARAEAAIARVRALHQPVGVVAAAEFGNPPDCAICGPNCQPCPTIRALDSEPAAPAATEATEAEKTARVFAALHRAAEQDVSRVIDLYERWCKTSPPFGTSMVGYLQWWREHLAELHDAILPAAEHTTKES